MVPGSKPVIANAITFHGVVLFVCFVLSCGSRTLLVVLLNGRHFRPLSCFWLLSLLFFILKWQYLPLSSFSLFLELQFVVNHVCVLKMFE